ncbi:hypothetical protein BC826DRAFT_514984 [Russula brevipes]|nr:hypothetical protein BC826DRAFT_514984 [Russula brevipes]
MTPSSMSGPSAPLGRTPFARTCLSLAQSPPLPSVPRVATVGHSPAQFPCRRQHLHSAWRQTPGKGRILPPSYCNLFFPVLPELLTHRLKSCPFSPSPLVRGAPPRRVVLDTVQPCARTCLHCAICPIPYTEFKLQSLAAARFVAVPMYWKPRWEGKVRRGTSCSGTLSAIGSSCRFSSEEPSATSDTEVIRAQAQSGLDFGPWCGARTLRPTVSLSA